MGIKLSCKINVKHNYKNIKKIEEHITGVVAEALKDVLKNIRGYAIRFERGHNNEGILCELINASTGEIKGRVYTDKTAMPFALFEHFGTGEYAEMNHIGKSKHFFETGCTEWYIPKEKAPRQLNYPIVKFYDQEFYVARGAKANHFMTDAEFKSRAENKDIFIKKINEFIREACK